MHINDLLRKATEAGASDLHLKVGGYPVLRINGELILMKDMTSISSDIMQALFNGVTTNEQKSIFSSELEVDFAYQAEDIGRFRINVCLQNGGIGITCRPVKMESPTMEELGLPIVCETLILKPSGLIIVTGPTGCGKSTTLAAMINYLNSTVKRKIITIEDPIEFVHRDINCIFSQREIGRDTRSFANALKHALRQDPDVILVGEMRDLETMAAVLTAAETGHLVLTTLHTQGAPEAIDRFIDVFPPSQQQQVRTQLAITLVGVLYQTLLPKRDNSGRAAAIEVMLATSAIKNLIREGKTHQMLNVVQTGAKCGMQSLNQALYKLYHKNIITREEAIARCSDQEELKSMLDGQLAY